MTNFARHFSSFVLAACLTVPVGGAHQLARADGDGMRCGTKLVSSGDSLLQVQDRCGAPDAASQRTELRIVRSWISVPCFKESNVIRCGQWVEQAVTIVIDDWTYDFGPSSLIRFLTFEQGKLQRVATGGYGNKGE